MDMPEREADVIALAWWTVQWLEQHPELAAGAPFSAAELRARIDAWRAAAASAAEAQTHCRAVHADTDAAARRLKDELAVELRYVEVDVRGRPERLSGLGWGGRPGATDREPPGQARDVAVRALSDGALVLEWRPPRDGGPAAEYRVQRRRLGGAWQWVATVVGNEAFLSDQPWRVDFDLRVVAVNKAGAGPPSDVVTVVL